MQEVPRHDKQTSEDDRVTIEEACERNCLLLDNAFRACDRGLPQGNFAWAARLHPQVRRVFANLFPDCCADDLATGMDQIFWADEDTAGPATANAQWLHVDQNHCSRFTDLVVQGVLYIWGSTNERSSTTVVWPDSWTPFLAAVKGNKRLCDGPKY